MIDYQIAIPSYKRPETIKKKTLKVLESHNIDPAKVTIFVAVNVPTISTSPVIF